MPQPSGRNQSSEAKTQSEPDANRPVEKFHEGPVHVSIWEKTGAKGLFRTASFQLRYRVGQEWKTSQSYGFSDLEHMEKAAHEARARIERWQQATMAKPDPRAG